MQAQKYTFLQLLRGDVQRNILEMCRQVRARQVSRGCSSSHVRERESESDEWRFSVSNDSPIWLGELETLITVELYFPTLALC